MAPNFSEWLKYNDSDSSVDNKTSSQLLEKHLLEVRHRFPYYYVLDKVKKGKILEIGTGSGVGTKILSENFNSNNIYSIDVSFQSLKEAEELEYSHYPKFIQANPGVGLPITNNYFDTAIIFQVVEHISPGKLDIFLQEINRVLKKDGKLFLTTPNRKLRLWPFQSPTNPYHEQEFNALQFEQILQNIFSDVNIYGIQTTKDNKSIELKRIGTSSNKIFLAPLIKLANFLGVTEYLKKIFLKFKEILFSNLKTNRKNMQETKNQITIEDFHMSSKNTDDSLDLFAEVTVKNEK